MRVKRVKTSWLLAALLIAGGVSAGIVGALLDLLLISLTNVHTHFSRTPIMMVVFPAIIGLISGICWWLLKRTGPVLSVNAALATDTRLPFLRTLADGLLQIFIVGAGASVGREQAPRQISAATTNTLASSPRISPLWRQRLVASAAGAGFAAVYNAPITGAIYAMEILPVKRDRYLALSAIVMAIIATVVARPIVGGGPCYSLPYLEFSWPVLIAVAIGIALSIIVGVTFRRLLLVRRPIPPQWLPITIASALAAVGAAAIFLPHILGNGQLIVGYMLSGSPTLTAAIALLVAKMVMTWVCLAAGAVGGILTPTMAVGSCLGMIVALTAHAGGYDIAVPILVITCACAMLAVTQRAPLFAIAFPLEITHPTPWVILAASVAGFSAYYATRRIR